MHSVLPPKIVSTERSVETDLKQHILHSANFSMITLSQIIVFTLGVLLSSPDDLTLAFLG